MGTELSKSSDMSKYLQVERILRSAIDNGVYQHNDKLPSIRQLVNELGFGKNTIIRAFQELEAQGLIYSVPKSGYRVNSIKSVQASHVKPTRVDLLSVCKEVLTYPNYKELLPTGSAHPNTDTPAIKSLYAEIGRHSRRQTHTASHYQLPPGDTLLIKQLAKITQDLGTPANVDEILVTHGAQQAISLALRAITLPGDIVAVESPCYFGNLLLLESLGLEVLEIPSCDYQGMDPLALESALAKWDVKVILITPNFTNPSSAVMPLERRKQLLSVSGTIPIIEDDVFGALSFSSPIPSLRALDDKQRVIYVNSLSKTLDSRLRIGWMLAGRYREQVEKYLLCENMGSLNLMQSAVGEFLTSGKYRNHISKMRRCYQNNAKRYIQLFRNAMDAHPELINQYHISGVQGSFLLWIRLPKSIDSYQLYQNCNQHKISILPGFMFGTHDQFKHCIRVSVANFDSDKNWRSGMELFVKLIAEQTK
ncbi:MAG: PLP-dependent aminotransferase family protein [Vibrionaceae bacterium]|nr:PLP-dependent aminotransferase family protein [Vibrionaceae bacterium]